MTIRLEEVLVREKGAKVVHKSSLPSLRAHSLVLIHSVLPGCFLGFFVHWHAKPIPPCCLPIAIRPKRLRAILWLQKLHSILVQHRVGNRIVGEQNNSNRKATDTPSWCRFFAEQPPKRLFWECRRTVTSLTMSIGDWLRISFFHVLPMEEGDGINPRCSSQE